MSKEIKICFVCTGNTCRSIMAERIAKDILKRRKIENVKVISRGVNATGENISVPAKRILKEMQINSANRKSIKLNKTDLSTIYVAMNEQIKNQIKGKTILIRDLIGEDISDPYGKSDEVYRQTAELLKRSLEILINKILKIRGEL